MVSRQGSGRDAWSASTVDDDLHAEGVLRLLAAKAVIDHVITGDASPRPWLSGARHLIVQGEWYLMLAATSAEAA